MRTVEDNRQYRIIWKGNINMTRLTYIDKLRGLAILLVVMGHICEKSLGIGGTFFNALYSSIHLPLFLFISGYLSNNLGAKAKAEGCAKYILGKAKHLLLPVLTIGTLFVVVNGFDMTYYDAYWFLPSLFYCICIHLVSEILGKNRERSVLILMILGWGILCVLYKCQLISFVPMILHFLVNFPFYVFGWFFRKEEEILTKNLVYTMCIFASFAIFFINQQLLYRFKVAGFFICIVLYILFKKNDDRLPSFLTVFGKNSLEIYTLHWFLLPNLLFNEDCLFRQNKQVVNSDNLLLLIIITGVIGYVICKASIVLSTIINESRFLSLVCWGKKGVKYDC